MDLSPVNGFGLLVVGRIQAQHSDALPARELLEKGFATIGKTHRVSILECLGALLDKSHFFDRAHVQTLL